MGRGSFQRGLPAGDPGASLVGVEIPVRLLDELPRPGIIGQVFPQVGFPALDEAADAPADGVVCVALVRFQGQDFAEGVAPDWFVVAAVSVH